MFLAIIALFVAFGFIKAKTDVYIPDVYTFHGTFSLPLANVTQNISVWFDKNRNFQKVSHQNGADYTVYDNKVFYQVLTHVNSKYCFKRTTKFEDMESEFLYYTPDLKKFEKLPMLYEINGAMCNHYRLLKQDTPDEPIRPVAPKPTHDFETAPTHNFVYTRDDQQDFYCLERNGMCLPVRWEIHGYNTIQHSHYDYYVIEYENFIAHTLEDEPMNFSEEQIAKDVANNKCYDLDEIEPHLDDDHTETIIKSYINNDIFLRKMGVSNYDDFVYKYAGYRRNNNLRDQMKMGLLAGTKEEKFRVFNEKSLFDDNGIEIFLPRELDWRKRGVLPPVKDQASCGSCWTFSAAGPLEGRINKLRIENEGYNKVSTPISVSEQSFVDCLRNEFNMGCNGGDPLFIYDTIMSNNDYNGKLALNTDYPYMGLDLVCQNNKWTYSDYFLSGVDMLEFDEETQKENPEAVRTAIKVLKRMLLDGPVSVGTDVPPSYIYYNGGIYDDVECKNKAENLGHAVIVEGWGVEKVKDKNGDFKEVEYWIVRNSWSNAWGANGYIYVAADERNICGILTDAIAPRIQKKQ